MGGRGGVPTAAVGIVGLASCAQPGYILLDGASGYVLLDTAFGDVLLFHTDSSFPPG